MCSISPRWAALVVKLRTSDIRTTIRSTRSIFRLIGSPRQAGFYRWPSGRSADAGEQRGVDPLSEQVAAPLGVAIGAGQDVLALLGAEVLGQDRVGGRPPPQHQVELRRVALECRPVGR